MFLPRVGRLMPKYFLFNQAILEILRVDKNVIEKNKEFIKYMHLLFMHFHKIESLKEVVSPIYVGDNITKSISKELKKISDCNYIKKINIMTQDAIEFRMYVYDIFSQHWIFTVDIKNNIELTKSIRWFDSHINYMISKEDIRINLYNSSVDKEHVFIMDEKNIK